MGLKKQPWSWEGGWVEGVCVCGGGGGELAATANPTVVHLLTRRGYHRFHIQMHASSSEIIICMPSWSLLHSIQSRITRARQAFYRAFYCNYTAQTSCESPVTDPIITTAPLAAQRIWALFV